MKTPPKIEYHNYLAEFSWIADNERKCRLILLLTLSMMGVELVYGYATHSMALLADGWHMGSHAGALFITYLTYLLAKNKKLHARFSFGTGKFIPLGGYTNAILLGVMAIWMGVESTMRLFNPQAIQYDEALGVTIVGLLVNIVSVIILGKDSHFHPGECEPEPDDGKDHAHSEGHAHTHGHSHADHSSHSDQNIKSAYFHVVADAFTSILAIIALYFGKHFNAPWLDAAMGILGGAIILRWSYTLVKDAAWELLDGNAKLISRDKLTKALEAMDAEVLDLHIWSIGPNVHACEVVLKTAKPRGPAPYKRLMEETFGFRHVIVEEWPA